MIDQVQQVHIYNVLFMTALVQDGSGDALMEAKREKERMEKMAVKIMFGFGFYGFQAKA